jgi:hypothetical protein
VAETARSSTPPLPFPLRAKESEAQSSPPAPRIAAEEHPNYVLVGSAHSAPADLEGTKAAFKAEVQARNEARNEARTEARTKAQAELAQAQQIPPRPVLPVQPPREYPGVFRSYLAHRLQSNAALAAFLDTETEPHYDKTLNGGQLQVQTRMLDVQADSAFKRLEGDIPEGANLFVAVLNPELETLPTLSNAKYLSVLGLEGLTLQDYSELSHVNPACQVMALQAQRGAIEATTKQPDYAGPVVTYFSAQAEQIPPRPASPVQPPREYPGVFRDYLARRLESNAALAAFLDAGAEPHYDKTLNGGQLQMQTRVLDVQADSAFRELEGDVPEGSNLFVAVLNPELEVLPTLRNAKHLSFLCLEGLALEDYSELSHVNPACQVMALQEQRGAIEATTKQPGYAGPVVSYFSARPVLPPRLQPSIVAAYLAHKLNESPLAAKLTAPEDMPHYDKTLHGGQLLSQTRMLDVRNDRTFSGIKDDIPEDSELLVALFNPELQALPKLGNAKSLWLLGLEGLTLEDYSALGHVNKKCEVVALEEQREAIEATTKQPGYDGPVVTYFNQPQFKTPSMQGPPPGAHPGIYKAYLAYCQGMNSDLAKFLDATTKPHYDKNLHGGRLLAQTRVLDVQEDSTFSGIEGGIPEDSELCVAVFNPELKALPKLGNAKSLSLLGLEGLTIEDYSELRHVNKSCVVMALWNQHEAIRKITESPDHPYHGPSVRYFLTPSTHSGHNPQLQPGTSVLKEPGKAGEIDPNPRPTSFDGRDKLHKPAPPYDKTRNGGQLLVDTRLLDVQDDKSFRAIEGGIPAGSRLMVAMFNPELEELPNLRNAKNLSFLNIEGLALQDYSELGHVNPACEVIALEHQRNAIEATTSSDTYRGPTVRYSSPVDAPTERRTGFHPDNTYMYFDEQKSQPSEEELHEPNRRFEDLP